MVSFRVAYHSLDKVFYYNNVRKVRKGGEMIMDNELKEFVQSHLVKVGKDTVMEDTIDIETTQDQIRTLSAAGFEQKSIILGRKVANARSEKEHQKFARDNMFAVNAPKFEKRHVGMPKLTNLGKVISAILAFWVADLIYAILTWSTIAGTISLTVGLMLLMVNMLIICTEGPTAYRDWPTYNAEKLTSGRFLVESSTQHFLGDVPQKVIDATVKAIKENYVPFIWFVGSAKEVPMMTQGMRPIKDPVLVGYKDGIQSKAVVLAIWGDDIEEIDKVLGDPRT